MKKIPTIFERDWHGNRSLVLNQPTPGCEWVFAGEGWPTQKIDGTSCFYRDHVWYRRREVKPGGITPAGFLPSEVDETTENIVGWVPIGSGPEDQYHHEAIKVWEAERATERQEGALFEVGGSIPLAKGTMEVDYDNTTWELVGPKIQGNPENVPAHRLLLHASRQLILDNEKVPRTFDGLKTLLTSIDTIEGIVFRHPDGRMAKIKGRDFGIKRRQNPVAATLKSAGEP